MSHSERPAHHDPHVPTGEWETYDEDSAESRLPEVQAPVFPVTLRGYDRSTVDAYVVDVERLIEELETTRSPTRAVERALDRVGEQTSGILQRARETAEDITTKSRTQSDDRLQTAEREARAMRQQAEARVRELDEDTERLWEERNRLLEDITRLSTQLGGVVEAANRRYPLVDAPPGSASAEAGEDETVVGAGPVEEALEGPDDRDEGSDHDEGTDPLDEELFVAGAETVEDEDADEEPTVWEDDGDLEDDDVVGEADEPAEDELGAERLGHEERAVAVEPYPLDGPRPSPRFAPRDRYASSRLVQGVRRPSAAPEPAARTPIFQRLLSLRPAGRP